MVKFSWEQNGGLKMLRVAALLLSVLLVFPSSTSLAFVVAEGYQAPGPLGPGVGGGFTLNPPDSEGRRSVRAFPISPQKDFRVLYNSSKLSDEDVALLLEHHILPIFWTVKNGKKYPYGVKATPYASFYVDPRSRQIRRGPRGGIIISVEGIVFQNNAIERFKTFSLIVELSPRVEVEDLRPKPPPSS